MKKLAIISMTLLFALAWISTPAHAGAKQRHRWQGVAIGVGAAMLGSAIIHDAVRHNNRSHAAVIVNGGRGGDCDPRPARNFRRGRGWANGGGHERCDRSGRWETRRMWEPSSYEKVWNPGHYDARHRWVTGQWMEVETDAGRWVERRVWVECR